MTCYVSVVDVQEVMKALVGGLRFHWRKSLGPADMTEWGNMHNLFSLPLTDGDLLHTHTNVIRETIVTVAAMKKIYCTTVEHVPF